MNGVAMIESEAARGGKRPPGPGGVGLVRLVMRLRDGLGFYEGLRGKYGEAVFFRMLHRRFCVLFDPELIAEVLVEKAASFEKGPAFKKTLIVSNPTTLTGDGEDHRLRRGLVQASFSRSKLLGYAEEMVGEAISVRDGWSEGMKLDLVVAAREFATSVVSATFFGRDVAVDRRVLEDTITALRWSMALTLVPFGGLVSRLPLRRNRFREAVCGRMDRVIGEALAKARVSEDRTDLVAALVGADPACEEGGGLREDEVRDEIYVMLLAGYESSATTLAWCFWHLSRSSGARARLEREVDEVLGDGRPEPDDYWRLEYAQAVVNETLRLTPPVYVVGRTALKDCRIGPWDIPKGTTVQPVWRMAQRDEVYFREAERFRPERWLNGEEAARSKAAYMAFGVGSRNCVGAAFAKMEIVFFLAAAAQRWRLEPAVEDYPETSSFGFYGFRKGLEVVVRGR